uniref:Alpha-1,3-glucosyltransferase n=1 Tax=Cacopsylla melanoneura TaxID=428564 RepID=A0A8D9FHD6_9HEMI
MIWNLFLASSCFKVLLIPAYTSTDFEVHRNWLAITSSLPLSQWYTDTTSPWTLDYPPLFAFFEYLLSFVAYYFDPLMLDVNNLNYKSIATLIFQRLSVIFSDLMLLYGVKECTNYFTRNKIIKSKNWAEPGSELIVFQILLIFNGGLFLIDHIHFQYNGFLFGFLLLSMAKILQGHYYEGAFWFAVLLNLKHIFIYVAPAYFVFLLRNHCFHPNKPASLKTLSWTKLVKLATVVLSVFAVSFGPFIGQLPQVLGRLFPFDDRGLCHAYWAPNFWALYNTMDKVAVVVGKQFDLISGNVTNTMTRGLVQNSQHAVLPSISPRICLTLTLLGILPCCYRVWKCPGNPLVFVRCLVLCAATSFVFGWHVHEKAILLVIIPLT